MTQFTAYESVVNIKLLAIHDDFEYVFNTLCNLGDSSHPWLIFWEDQNKMETRLLLYNYFISYCYI